ncbi:MAG: GAF domain-containing protein [Caldilineae bacterium]|nr:MAG: GAF domain-containing protein [Caldilineae bacterium]
MPEPPVAPRAVAISCRRASRLGRGGVPNVVSGPRFGGQRRSRSMHPGHSLAKSQDLWQNSLPVVRHANSVLDRRPACIPSLLCRLQAEVMTTRTLRTKILVLVGGVFVAVLLVMLGIVYVTESREIEEEGLKQAQALSRMAFEALYASMREGGGHGGNRQVIARLQRLGTFTHIAVIKGEPVVRQYGARPDELAQDDLERQALTGVPQQQVRREGGHRLVRYVMPVRVEAECQRCHNAEIGAINGVVSTEISLEAYDAALRRTRNILLLTIVAGLVLLGLLASVSLHRIVIRPLRMIREGTALFAAGNLRHRFHIKTGDELEELAEAFNQMASRVEQSYAELEDRVAERTRELVALNRIAATVNRSLNLDETLPAVLDEVVALCGADAADIRVLENGGLCLRAGRGLSQAFVAQDGHLSPGRCLCGLAAQTNSSHSLGDLNEIADVAAPCLAEGFLSGLAVPVLVKNQVVGVMHLGSRRAHAFDGRHQGLLEAVGQHVGLAIEKERLYQGERSQRQLAETLRRMSQTVSASLDLDVVLHTLLDQLAEVLIIDVGLILLREGDELCVAAVRGREELHVEQLVGYRFPVAASDDFRQVIAEKRVLTFCEVGRQPPFREGLRRIEEVNWCMVVPLLRGEDVIGLLALEQLDHCYDDEEEPQIAMAFANSAVMAIENARLYAEVKALNEELEQRVLQRTEELERARATLDRQARQLRHLLNKTIRVQEEERDRIAQDIHDGVTQLLMGALYKTQAARVAMMHHPAEAQEKLLAAQEILKKIKEELRRIIYDLHPVVLTEKGLVAALEAHLQDIEAHTGISCEMRVAGEQRRLRPDQERAIYRVVQEALNNVAKHAATRHASLTLDFGQQELLVVVEDRGAGFLQEVAKEDGDHKSLGMAGMRERAQSIGAELRVDSSPGRGTRVRLRLPLQSNGRMR